MNAENRSAESSLPLATSTSLPADEPVLDRLADLLYETDELLDMLKGSDAMHMHSVEPAVRNVYDEINALMKRLCD